MHANWFLRRIAPALGLIVVFTLGVACTTDTNDDDDAPDQSPIPIETPEIIPPEPPAADTDDTPVITTCAAPEAISWIEAVDYVGSEQAVFGPVYSVEEGDGMATLTIGTDEVEPARRFDVVLTQNALADIAGDLNDLYPNDEQVCAIGVVQAVGGNIQIVVNEMEDFTRF